LSLLRWPWIRKWLTKDKMNIEQEERISNKEQGMMKGEAG
jgi:hypothetical protein